MIESDPEGTTRVWIISAEGVFKFSVKEPEGGSSMMFSPGVSSTTIGTLPASTSALTGGVIPVSSVAIFPLRTRLPTPGFNNLLTTGVFWLIVKVPFGTSIATETNAAGSLPLSVAEPTNGIMPVSSLGTYPVKESDVACGCELSITHHSIAPNSTALAPK